MKKGEIKDFHRYKALNSTVSTPTKQGENLKLALAMLQVSEERISVVDELGKFLAVSPSVAHAWQTTERALLGTTLPKLIGKACFEKNIRHVFSGALSGKPGYVEFWYHANTEIKTSRLFKYSLSPFYSSPHVIDGVIIHVLDITAQRQVENELATAKQRLQDFADATSDWYWEMNADLKFTWISSAYYDFYGVDPSTLYGKPRSPVLETEEDYKAWAHHSQLLKDRKPFRDYYLRVQTPNGVVWSRTSGVPIFIDGSFRGYRGTASDATKLKEDERKVLRAESRFIHAIDEFPGSFALFDEDDYLVVYNKHFHKLHEELGDELKPGLSNERCLQLRRENNLFVTQDESGEEWVKQRLNWIRNPDGSMIVRKSDSKWYRVSEQHLPDGGCLRTMLDITEQKNAELTINEERNLLRSLIDSIPHMIYAKNRDLEYTVINKATADFFGRLPYLSAPQNLNNSDRELDYSRSKKVDRQVIDEEHALKNEEHRITRESDGKEIWVSTCKSPLYDINRKVVGLVGATSDITARKKIEADHVRSEARFRDFAETAADWFWEMDADHKVSYLSERYSEITDSDTGSLISADYLAAADILLTDASAKEKFIQCIEASQPFSDLEASINTSTGETRHFFISGKPWFDEHKNFCGFRGAGRDVTSFRELENKLSYQASHDELTGLTNRRKFMQRLDQLVILSQQQKTNAVLGYLDLDQFKVINDTAGHQAGDQLLIQVAQLIKNCIRKSDTLARLGGDEFGILLHETNASKAEATMRRILSQLDEIRFPWGDNLFSIGGSVGLVTIDDNNDSSTELLSKADLACYSAKDAGRGTTRFYHAQNDDIIDRHSQLTAAASITEALENDRFVLYAQPIYPINQTQQAEVHYEVLLRMLDEQDQIVSPGAFIPAAERYHLMARIDRWVISNALQQMKQVFNSCCACGVSINLSGQSLSDPGLIDFVQQHLDLNGIAPSRICFEITETAAISNFNFAQNFIDTLKDVGCTFALDDFGSGLSSFGYLKHFKVDYLKIDGSFVRDIVTDPTDRVMVTSINQVGKLLGMKTIAEFVENQEILDVLTEINVDFVQGYAMGKPQRFDRAIMFPGN